MARLPDATAPFPPLVPLTGDPLVSVCVTSRNYEQFVAEAVASALGQRYDKVEVIVVDDGSTDGSRTVLAGFGDRIRLILQDNAGQAASGRRALADANGELVMFLDADDWLDDDAVASAVAAFRADPEAVLVQWRMRTVDASGHDVGRDRPKRPGLMPNGDLREQLLRNRNFYGQLTSGVMYRTEVLRNLLTVTLPPGERNGLDRLFNTMAPFFGTVRSLDDIHSAYRVHGESVSSVAALDGRYPRRLIQLTVYGHEDARKLARDLGLPDPGGVDDLLDPAFFGWRLWSLRLDPAHHPFPDDRPWRLALRGIRATVAHPGFPWRHKLKRSVWFVAMLLPRRFTPRVIQWYVPDGPRVVAGNVVA